MRIFFLALFFRSLQHLTPRSMVTSFSNNNYNSTNSSNTSIDWHSRSVRIVRDRPCIRSSRITVDSAVEVRPPGLMGNV